jgi:hypothetical protein
MAAAGLKPGQSKRTKIQQQGMEEIVYQLIMKGETYRNVMNILMEKYSYTKVNAEKIYLKVIYSFKEKNPFDADELRQKYLEMYQDLYKQAVINRETLAAKQIMDSIVKLQGLITQKVEAKIDQVFEVKF